ncbi:hypothetical protein [Eubacterium sp.]
MYINGIDKKTLREISERFGERFIKDPLFMFFCSDINKRKAFIYDYMMYYLPRLVDEETVFIDKHATAVVTLVDPNDFEYKFKGLSGQKLKKYSFSSKVFLHKENLEEICETVLPGNKQAMVLTVYSDPNGKFDSLRELIAEAVDFADREDITLIYDTFSRKYIDYMQSKDFVVAYSKPFMDTQFIETVMTYNV